MTGLNLMRLLVQNRIAEFHTELEVLPAEASACPFGTLEAYQVASVLGSYTFLGFL